ncbi:hypothetical protein M9H77_19858 [Catharanthus roseus]|uniref:Uncharacterized protein n=1 Tax=Catharanthus roseus TaxID=4058 RepID=A0ACC0BBI2_CATRO|nr:hypothetical protein M9H77_19858 [Catharanthus roseus]
MKRKETVSEDIFVLFLCCWENSKICSNILELLNKTTGNMVHNIRRVLFLKVPEARKPLLLSEIDRVAQDYKIHRDEIHSKLVQIMKERLLVHLRGLPQIVESWNRPEDSDLQPSQFARSLTKWQDFSLALRPVFFCFLLSLILNL